jgi:glycosyltransferase involved in cell wall biosynthesis
LAIESADVLVHLAKTELEHIARVVGATVDPSRVRIVPLAVEDRTLAAPAPSDTFRVAWWGTYIPLHGLPHILEATRLLKERGRPIHLALLGMAGPGHDDAVRQVSEIGIRPWVDVRTDETFVNGRLTRRLETECDLALGIFGDTEKARVVIPNKVLDAFALGLPVLTMSSPALGELIDVETELFTCTNTAEAIADTIEAIRGNPVEASRRSLAGRLRYEETFSMERYREAVLGLVESV